MFEPKLFVRPTDPLPAEIISLSILIKFRNPEMFFFLGFKVKI